MCVYVYMYVIKEFTSSQKLMTYYMHQHVPWAGQRILEVPTDKRVQGHTRVKYSDY